MEPSLLFSLADFDRDILRPSASLFSRAMSTRRKASSFAEMVAGFFWLLFGLDAEYFPEEHSQSLFSQRFVQFVSDFKNTIEDGVMSSIRSLGHYCLRPATSESWFSEPNISACMVRQSLRRQFVLRL